jgi:hypothetical protein
MAKRKSKYKVVQVVLIIAALAAIGGAIYVKTSNQPTGTQQLQNNNASNHSAGQTGGVSDNNKSQQGSAGKGSAASSPAATAQSASSASGVITLTSPTSGSAVGNGTSVTGTANGLSQVQFRIKDTQRGVIAQGPLNVVNGSFSGTIEGLEPGSSSGTFEVYDYKNGNGPEENDVKINVNFK